MVHSWSRFRLWLANSFASIVIVLIVLSLFGGWLTYTTHITPGTHVENRTTAEWESTGIYTHSATVTNGSAAFPEGSTLSNQSTYFSSVTPTLDGEFIYSYHASAGTIKLNTTLQFVLHSIEDTDKNATEYWQVTREISSDQASSLSPDTSFKIPFSENISAAQKRATRIEEQIGGSPGMVEALVIAQIHIKGEIEGEQVSRTRRYTLPIEVQTEKGQYHVDDPGPIRNATTLHQRINVGNGYDTIRQIGSVLLLALPLGLLVSLVSVYLGGFLNLSESERNRLETRQAHEEFDEWITSARLPDAVLENPKVEINSLEELVDVAIDTNNRVIDNLNQNQYIVLGDDVYYTYSVSDSKDDSKHEE